MSVINTNITSMIGQQNLSKSQNDLATSMERLSSGLRINSAKDDAAGQAIANRMSSQITGLGQSQRNANDGISMAQTAEGALNQVNDNLQRVRELTVQAQNGTNSQDDLTSIQNEIGQRLNEINRISEETTFNGVQVLASDQGINIQVGANDGETISVNLEEINAGTLNMQGFNVDGTGEDNTLASATQIKAQGFSEQTDGSFTNATFNSEAGIAEGLNQLKDGGTVTDSAGATYTFNADSNSFTFDEAARADASGTALADALTPSGNDTNTLTITDGTNNEIEVNVDSSGNVTRAGDGAQLYFDSATGNLTENNAGGHTAAAIDDVASFLATDTGAVMTIESGDTTYTATGTAGEYDVAGDTISRAELETTIENGTTANFSIDADGDASDDYTLAASGTLLDGGSTTYVSGFDSTRLESTATATLYQNDEGTFTDGLSNEVYAQDDGTLTFDEVSNSTATEDPLATIDAALNQVDSLRSDLGAIQNRFESAITNLSTNETNLSAARSRIEDADYATEVANMTRSQILQQAGTSVLAQANQLPQSVLSLLG